MSTEIVSTLLEKRSERVAQVAKLQSAIFHMDETLRSSPSRRRAEAPARVFAHGELVALVGDAERSGAKTNMAVVEHVMRAKGHDPNDALRSELRGR